MLMIDPIGHLPELNPSRAVYAIVLGEVGVVWKRNLDFDDWIRVGEIKQTETFDVDNGRIESENECVVLYCDALYAGDIDE